MILTKQTRYQQTGSHSNQNNADIPDKTIYRNSRMNNLSNKLPVLTQPKNQRLPAPNYSAPKQPNYISDYRTQTLNRLEFSQKRKKQVPFNTNMTRFNSKEPIYWKPKPEVDSNNNNYDYQHIYAPASIATSMPNNHIEQNHYAATSLTTNNKRSPSSIGRESSIGSLIGSLRRKRRNLMGSLRLKKKQEEVIKLDQPIYGNTINDTIHLDLEEIYNKSKGKGIKAEHIYAEGQLAIDSNRLSRKSTSSNGIDVGSNLSDGESKWIILNEDQQTNYLQLISMLRNWINDLLAPDRIIVMDLQEDLYDGQILVRLFEKLQNVNLDLIEVTQNENLQRQRLSIVLGQLNRILTREARWAKLKWSVNGIHSKCILDIVHLLVFLAIHYRAPMRLPANVIIRAVEISKQKGEIKHKSHQIQLTKIYETSLDDETDSEPDYFDEFKNPVRENSILSRPSGDAFDELINHKDKLRNVCHLLVKFANRHLNRLNMSCTTIDNSLANKDLSQLEILNPDRFTDGLLLVFLIASLENYFIPLGFLYTTSKPRELYVNNDTLYEDIDNSAIQEDSYINTHPIGKLHNVNFAFQLMEEAGIEDIRKCVRAEDIVNGDLKSILRILYTLFSHYKHL